MGKRRPGRAAVPKGTAEQAGLTDQQERFAQEYSSNGGLAKQAALAAGYAESMASTGISQLLSNPRVAARIRELQAEVAVRLGITREKVIEGFAARAFARLEHILDLGPAGVTPKSWADMPDAERQSVVEASQTVSKDGGSIRVKMADQLEALDKLARILGLYDDKLTVKTPWDAQLAAMTEDELWAKVDALQAAREKK